MVVETWTGIKRGTKKPLLMLGNPPANAALEATRVDTSPGVKAELARIADIAFSRLREFEALPYSETRLLEDDQYFYGSVAEILGLDIAGADGGEQAPSHDDGGGSAATALSVAIDAARSTDRRLSLGDVQSARFVFYIVVVQDADGKDVALVRKTTGLKVATENKFFMKYADKLAKLEEPIFRIDYYFDFAIRGDEIAIWNPDNFLKLFSDVDALSKAVPSYVGAIGANLGVALSTDTKEFLISSGSGSARLGQQIRRISRLSHLKAVSPQSLKDYLADVSALQHGITMKKGVVSVPEEAVGAFLHLLEQRLWKGPFDGAVRQAQAFARLTN
jgi:hypothetical protein